MKKFYRNRKRVSGVRKVGIGEDIFTVTCDFTPNFFSVDFVEPNHKQPDSETPDAIYLDLVKTPTGYALTVTAESSELRKVRYILAELPVNPELQRD